MKSFRSFKLTSNRESTVCTTASEGHVRSLIYFIRAEQFDVTLPFLLQQAAWLYERQLSQVRAQMRKVNTKHSVAPSPVPGSVSGSATAGGHATRRAGSGAAGKLRGLRRDMDQC